MSRRPFLPLAAAALTALALAGCASDAPSSGTATDAADTGYVTDGKLTIATGEPAYYPWVIDDDPESGEGFEAAVAYAVAEELGFADDDVVWVRTTFDEAIAPGPKDFDFNLQQFSITRRAQAVRRLLLAVLRDDAGRRDHGRPRPRPTRPPSPTCKDLLIGAQTGTTSFTAIEQVIQPTAGRAGVQLQRRRQAGSRERPGRRDRRSTCRPRSTSRASS